MTTPGARLKYFIENKGVTLSNFCEIHGLDYKAINKIVNNSIGLGVKVLSRFKEILPEMDADWILFGDNESSIVKSNDLNIAEESPLTYETANEFEKLIFKAMEKPQAKTIIEGHIKKIMLQMGEGSAALTITEGEENSPFMQRLEDIARAEQEKNNRDKSEE